MKNRYKLLGLLTCILFLTSGFLLHAAASEPIVIRNQSTLPNGLKTAVKGTVNSAADLSNGNLSAQVIMKSEQDPATVKAPLADGVIQINADSSFTALSGTKVSESNQSITFSLNSNNQNQPSLLISQVGHTQAGVSLDLLVKVQHTTQATTDKSFVAFSGSADGALTVAPTNLNGVTVSYQFQDSQTHHPISLLLFPVIGDIDYAQQFQLNGQILGKGGNLSVDADGIATSDGTPTNGMLDFPLGGLVYQFYGDTLTSTFNNDGNGTVGTGTSAFSIFGNEGSLKNITISKPDFGPVKIPKATWSIDQSQYRSGQNVTATLNQPINALDQNINHRYADWQTTLTVPTEIQNPAVGLYDSQDNLVPETITPISDHHYQITISSDTMNALPFAGETYHYRITGQLNPHLTDGTSLTFNAVTDLDHLQDTIPAQVGPIAHKASIKVRYLRQGSTDSVLKSKAYTFGYGKTWQVPTPAAPDGYYYDQIDTKDPTSGTVDFGNKTITLYYAPTEKTIHIKYVDEKGQAIANETSFKANYLDAYTSSAKDLDDEYSLITSEIPKNAAGVVGNQDETVTYVYRQISGKWMDLGYGSRGITRLDYHGHIRSNALNYADGQIITLINTSDGIELFQDTVDDGAVSEQPIKAGQTGIVKVAANDTITAKVLAMGSVLLTRQAPNYTMTTVIKQGNFTNRTKVYHQKELIEEDEITANGVKGLLTQETSEQVIAGKIQVTAKDLTKTGADLSPNTSVIDAPATEFTSRLNGAEDDDTTDTSSPSQATPSLQSNRQSVSKSNSSHFISEVIRLFKVQKVSADEISERSDLTNGAKNNITESGNPSSLAPSTDGNVSDDEDTMAENPDTFSTSLTGSATLPDDSSTAFDQSGATGDLDDQKQAGANFTGQVEVSATASGKVLKHEVLNKDDEMILDFSDPESQQNATIIVQPQHTGLAVGQKLASGKVLPLDHGQLPKTGSQTSALYILAGLVVILSALFLIFFKRRKEGQDA